MVAINRELQDCIEEKCYFWDAEKCYVQIANKKINMKNKETIALEDV